MTEEEKIFAGRLFASEDAALCEKKRRAHGLCAAYNRTAEEDMEARASLLAQLFAGIGPDCLLLEPIFVHYGCHTTIGKNFFANFNLTIQDDAKVQIGDFCSFGPNVTIVTPIHPMVASERRALRSAGGTLCTMCYAKPVVIGNDCWFGANVVVCPGVTIGDGCVIGAGSVVTRDVSPGCFAAGNPCRVIREITEADSMALKPEILGDASVL